MKEELVQRLMDIGGCGAETEWAQGYDDGVNAAIDEVERYFKQPHLNENQQIVLEWLKDKCNLCSFIAYQPFGAFKRLNMLDHQKNEIRLKNAIDELTYLQQAQVLEVFSRWAQKQEE